jgi:hypothetical protein
VPLLKEVKPGRRIRWPYCGRSATVVHHGPMGTVVRYRDSKPVQFQRKSGDVVTATVTFEAKGKNYVVASESTVEVLK